MPAWVRFALSLAALLAVAPNAAASPIAVEDLRAISGSTPFPGGCPPSMLEAGTQGAAYEPYVAVDSRDNRHLAATWIQDGGLANVAATSRDSGLTWKVVPVPGVSHCTGGRTGGAVDPWLAFGPDGALYMSSLGVDVDQGFPLTNARSQVWVNRSGNDGASWTPGAAAQPDDGQFYDKPSITADPDRPGHMWAVFARRFGPAGAGGVTELSETTDGGATWTPARTIYDPGALPFPQWPHGNVISVLPDGRLLDVFGLMNDSPFISSGAAAPDTEMAIRSTDGGRTWSAPVTIAQIPSRLPADGDSSGQRLIALPLPTVAVDRAKIVYVAWHENPSPTTGRIVLARSADGGRSWSAPAAAANLSAQAFLPMLAADRAGDLGLLWYDTRGDVPGDGRLDARLWFAHSHDRGRTWDPIPVSAPFDALTGPDFFNQGHELGDYIGLAPYAHGFDAVFTLAKPLSNGGATSVFFARLALSTAIPRLTLAVRPARARAGRRTRFRFFVRSGRRRLAGALVRFAGRRLHTGVRGRAAITLTLRRRGRYPAVASLTHYVNARATVKVVAAARAGS